MIEDDRLPLKKKFLEYFKDVPVQKFGAMYIGVSEDTIGRWKIDDVDFADSIDNLKAEFVRSKLKDVKNVEWTLERMFKREFAQRTEITGADGKDLPTPLLTGIVDVHNNDSPKETPKP